MEFYKFATKTKKTKKKPKHYIT